jgi:hypothetical protein
MCPLSAWRTGCRINRLASKARHNQVVTIWTVRSATVVLEFTLPQLRDASSHIFIRTFQNIRLRTEAMAGQAGTPTSSVGPPSGGLGRRGVLVNRGAWRVLSISATTLSGPSHDSRRHLANPVKLLAWSAVVLQYRWKDPLVRWERNR